MGLNNTATSAYAQESVAVVTSTAANPSTTSALTSSAHSFACRPSSTRAPSFRSAAAHWERKHGQACPYSQPAGEHCPYRRLLSHDISADQNGIGSGRNYTRSSAAALSAPGGKVSDDTFGSGFLRAFDDEIARQEEEKTLFHLDSVVTTENPTTFTGPFFLSASPLGSNHGHKNKWKTTASTADIHGLATVMQAIKGKNGATTGTAVHIGRTKIPTLLETHRRVIIAALHEVSRPYEGPFENLGERLGGERDGFTYCDRGSIRFSRGDAVSGVSTDTALARCASARCSTSDGANGPEYKIGGGSGNATCRRGRTVEPSELATKTRLPKFHGSSTGRIGSSSPKQSLFSSSKDHVSVEEQHRLGGLRVGVAGSDGNNADKFDACDAAVPGLENKNDGERQTTDVAVTPTASRRCRAGSSSNSWRASGGEGVLQLRPGAADSLRHPCGSSMVSRIEDEVATLPRPSTPAKRRGRSSPSMIGVTATSDTVLSNEAKASVFEGVLAKRPNVECSGQSAEFSQTITTGAEEEVSGMRPDTLVNIAPILGKPISDGVPLENFEGEKGETDGDDPAVAFELIPTEADKGSPSYRQHVDTADINLDKSESVVNIPVEKELLTMGAAAETVMVSAARLDASTTAMKQCNEKAMLRFAEARASAVTRADEKVRSQGMIVPTATSRQSERSSPADSDVSDLARARSDDGIDEDILGRLSREMMPLALDNSIISTKCTMGDNFSSNSDKPARRKRNASDAVSRCSKKSMSSFVVDGVFVDDDSSTQGAKTVAAAATAMPHEQEYEPTHAPNSGEPSMSGNLDDIVSGAKSCSSSMTLSKHSIAKISVPGGNSDDSNASGNGPSSPISWESHTAREKLVVSSDGNDRTPSSKHPSSASQQQAGSAGGMKAAARRTSEAIALESIALGLLLVAATNVMAKTELDTPPATITKRRRYSEASPNSVVEKVSTAVAGESIRRVLVGATEAKEVSILPLQQVVMVTSRSAKVALDDFDHNGHSLALSLIDACSGFSPPAAAAKKEVGNGPMPVYGSHTPPTPTNIADSVNKNTSRHFPHDHTPARQAPVLPLALLSDLLVFGGSSLNPVAARPRELSAEREQEVRACEERSQAEPHERAHELFKLEALVRAEGLDSYPPAGFSRRELVYGEGKHSIVYHMELKASAMARGRGESNRATATTTSTAAGGKVRSETITTWEDDKDVAIENVLAKKMAVHIVGVATARAMSVTIDSADAPARAVVVPTAAVSVELEGAAAVGMASEIKVAPTMGEDLSISAALEKLPPADIPTELPTVFAGKEFRYLRPEAPAAVLRDARREVCMHLRVRNCKRVVSLQGVWLSPRVTLLLEAMDAGSLHRFIRQGGLDDTGPNKKSGKTEEEEHRSKAQRVAARLVGQAAEGLAALHRAGIVHRDVKSHNVMICASREGYGGESGYWEWDAKLGDLGSAAFIPAEGEAMLREQAGTSGWVAPEVRCLSCVFAHRHVCLFNTLENLLQTTPLFCVPGACGGSTRKHEKIPHLHDD